MFPYETESETTSNPYNPPSESPPGLSPYELTPVILTDPLPWLDYFQPPKPLSPFTNFTPTPTNNIPWLPPDTDPPLPPWLDPNNPGLWTGVTQESFNAAITDILNSMQGLNETIFSLHGGMAFIHNASVAIHNNQIAMGNMLFEMTEVLADMNITLADINTALTEINTTLTTTLETLAAIGETQYETAAAMTQAVTQVNDHLYRHQEATNFNMILSGLLIALVIALIFATSWKAR